LKAAVQEASVTAWLALGKKPPAKYLDEQRRYKEEQADIQKKAEEKEHQRDEKSKEADELIHHHGFAGGVALFQVSIALGAVAAPQPPRLVQLHGPGPRGHHPFREDAVWLALSRDTARLIPFGRWPGVPVDTRFPSKVR